MNFNKLPNYELIQQQELKDLKSEEKVRNTHDKKLKDKKWRA